jgi:tetratricopeptide repeat protein 30
MRQSAPEDAYRKLDDLAKKHIDVLRKMTKQVGDAKHAREDDSVREAIKNYDEALEKYIPVLMGQAKIYWDHENYQQVEKMFRQSNEFCREHDVSL